MEAIVLALVALSPWAFGSVEPDSEFLLLAGVAVLLAPWGVRMLLEWRLRWAKCPVAFCLALLFLGGTWQLMSWSGEALAWLSPATAQLYEQLIPAQAEVLPLNQERPVVDPPPGTTITLYPGATQAMRLRLLAVFVLFAAVRTNIASAAALRRLALVALANGTLLALLGLMQFFTSPGNTIYWSYPTEGQVFGPFVNRNHFAFYLNVCVGLGAGLLLNRFHQLSRTRRGRDHAPVGSTWGRTVPDRVNSALNLLLDPLALGMTCALALMLGSVVFCLSRGGFAALVGGAMACLMIQLAPSRRSRHRGALLPLGLALLTLATMALALVAWFGLGPVAARLEKLWDDPGLPGGRTALWARTLPLVGQFPLWGTGYGTFRYLEPLHAADAEDAAREYIFAHNEYLEALVEGGLVRLIPSVLAVGLVAWLGYRAIRRQRGHSADGLALGAFFGFVTIALHSVVEFGLHIPAIALLATVLCAHLGALGGDEQGDYVFRYGGLAPVAGAATAVALGLVLLDQGWAAARAEPARRSAALLRLQTDAESRQLRLAYLEIASALMPEDAPLRIRLAQAHVAIYEDGIQALEKAGRGDDTAQAELAVQHLVPALGHFLHARDLCPILPDPHLGIASHIEALEQAEPRGAYLERAKRLAPADPLLWYLYGLQDLDDGRPEQAWPSWRRCLELSDHYRPVILDVSAQHLAPDEIIRRVIPDRPEVLLAAADYLYPEPKTPEAKEGRRRILERVLLLWEQGPAPLSANDLHLQAQVYRSLHRPEEALASLRAALDQEPLQVEWRFELAQLLAQQGLVQEAHRELLRVLDVRPLHAPALALRKTVARRIAETR
jgi:O-antigen ligase